MRLPDLTHLQFLILGILMDSELAGKEVREQLAKAGIKKTGPAFYQLMARLEDSNFVKGWYDEKVIDGQRIKERRYKITSGGVRACHQTRDFYLERADKLLGGLANG